MVASYVDNYVRFDYKDTHLVNDVSCEYHLGDTLLFLVGSLADPVVNSTNSIAIIEKVSYSLIPDPLHLGVASCFVSKPLG